MLLVFPSSPMTHEASAWLAGQGISNTVIPLPERLDYKTGANHALWIDSLDNMAIPMQLSRERFVVMRVFRDFVPTPDERTAWGLPCSGTD